ncbi:MAG: PQQ-dependent sugar dehydrogenase [Gammaproteobacteria bacterium]
MTSSRRRALSAAALLLSVGVGASAWAQQKVPFANGVPVAPTGLADQPLGAGPFNYRTAEQQDIRVTVLTRDIDYPYSLAFLPTGELLITTRTGQLRIMRDGKLDPNPITGGPASHWGGKSGGLFAVHGYMSLVVHPRFAENHWIYFSYTKPLDESSTTVCVARARLDKNALSDVRDIFVGDKLHGAVSLAMTPDGMLWLATGGDSAQDPKTLVGKVLRLKDDGSVPSDNPFVARKATVPRSTHSATAARWG